MQNQTSPPPGEEREPHATAGPHGASSSGTATSLAEAFETAAAEHPDAVALIAEDGTFTYRQLDGWSLAIAALLRSHGVRPGDRVALRMPSCAAAIASLAGILRAGASYVPLDTRNPRARNEFIVRDARIAALVGDPDGCVDGGTTVIGADRITALHDGDGRPVNPGAPGPGPGPDDEAYTIYTSGTTGNPKGVPIHHRAALGLLAAAGRRFSLRADDRWLLFHSLAFDLSVWEIWVALTTGAAVVVTPHWTTRSPEESLRFISAHGITMLSLTPTAFAEISAAALREGTDLSHLRYMFFAGEKLLPATLGPWAERHGLARPRLVNLYGPTEAAVHAVTHEVTRENVLHDQSVIGRPLPGFTLRVVTADGRDASPGEQGELWLSGPQVTKGYLNRPELNAKRFTEGPAAPDGGPAARYYRTGDLVSPLPTGELLFHGRADLQVKLRGHRIELSDIETAVRAHPDVAGAVVWIRAFGPGDDRLVCAFVPAATETAPTARALRGHVAQLLPNYMRPAAYTAIARLPRTTNGKVDRAEVVRLWEKERENAR